MSRRGTCLNENGESLYQSIKGTRPMVNKSKESNVADVRRPSLAC